MPKVPKSQNPRQRVSKNEGRKRITEPEPPYRGFPSHKLGYWVDFPFFPNSKNHSPVQFPSSMNGTYKYECREGDHHSPFPTSLPVFAVSRRRGMGNGKKVNTPSMTTQMLGPAKKCKAGSCCDTYRANSTQYITSQLACKKK